MQVAAAVAGSVAVNRSGKIEPTTTRMVQDFLLDVLYSVAAVPRGIDFMYEKTLQRVLIPLEGRR